MLLFLLVPDDLYLPIFYFFEIVDKIVDVLDKNGIIKDAEEEEEVEGTIYIVDRE